MRVKNQSAEEHRYDYFEVDCDDGKTRNVRLT